MAARTASLAVILLAVMMWLAAAGGAVAQGFAGLGADVDGFAEVAPGKRFVFPADHGPHENYRIEWWYVTANLTDAETGAAYGVQWTLFRSALKPATGAPARRWGSNTMFMGHAALTTASDHFYAEKFARGGVGQARVAAAPFNAHIDDWTFKSAADDGGLEQAQLAASGAGFAFDLALSAQGPIVLQGEKGYSVKSQDGQASYYYSQPFYDVDGEIIVNGRTRRVTGKAWLDREWSSQFINADQSGWDWVSLHFADGAKLMAFRLRSHAGAPYYAGTWIDPDGAATPLAPDAITLAPLKQTRLDGFRLPTRWRLKIAAREIDVTINALNAKSWMALSFPYWEGPIAFAGSHEGVGYLEMTGYGAASTGRR